MAQILTTTLMAGIVVVLTILFGMLFLGIDRKVAARFQARIGPPIVQPFRDFIKLLAKQTIIPENSIKWLFSFAPVLAVASSLLLVLYLPFLDMNPVLGNYGDIIVVLYLLLVPGIAMVVGGLASSSKYATIGAQRKMVTMMSYELPLATLVIAMVWRLSSVSGEAAFSFSTFASYPILNHVGIIGIIGLVFLFIAILITICGELIKTPFDAPEADTELAEGLLVEYSGRNLGLFILSDAAKLVAFVTLIIALFFPYRLSSFIDMGMFNVIGNAIFFIIKFFIIAFVGLSFERVAFARLKIDQVARFFWVYSLGISLIGLLLIVIDTLI